MAGRARERGARYLIGGPRLWSKDELINGILAAEFPPPRWGIIWTHANGRTMLNPSTAPTFANRADAEMYGADYCAANGGTFTTYADSAAER
jgi:hypothetical protein